MGYDKEVMGLLGKVLHGPSFSSQLHYSSFSNVTSFYDFFFIVSCKRQRVCFAALNGYHHNC